VELSVPATNRPVSRVWDGRTLTREESGNEMKPARG
jgi:hypothetical protein